MGFWQRFKGRESKAVDTSGASWITSAARGASGDAKRGTGELIALFNESPPLRAVVSKIGEQIASAEWTLTRPASTRRAVATENVPVLSGPMFELLKQPNPQLSLGAFNAVLQAWIDLKDEAFVIYERDKSGAIVELWPAAPQWVRVENNGSITVQWPGTGARVHVPEGEFAWILNPNPADPYGRGYGIGDALADDLDTDEAAAKFVKAFFRNSAKPDVLLILKNVKDRAQLEQAKEYWEGQLRGAGKNNRVHFAAGEVDLKEFGQGFKDTNVVALREDIAARVRQTYGISPELFGALDSSNRATITQALRILDLTVIQPRLKRLRDFWQLVADRVEPGVLVEVRSNLPEDREFTLEVLRSAPWAASINEWRALGGLAPVEDGDRYVVPYTLTTVESFDELSMPEIKEPAPEALAAPEPVKMLAAPVRKMSDADINEVLEALQPSTLTRRAGPVYKANVEEWGVKAMEELGVSDEFNMLKPFVVNHLRDFSSKRIVGINQTTQREIGSALSKGLAAGEGAVDLAKRVREVFDTATRARSVLIARTEACRSSNFATTEAWTQSGIVTGKQWVATPDDRTRDTHAELDGTIVEMGEPFEIGGAQAEFPGDFDDPAETCNCRCTVAAVTSQRSALEVEQRVALWKVYDRDLITTERELRAAFVRGFREQERETLAALETLF
jgi:HK97 family phage portal protein